MSCFRPRDPLIIVLAFLFWFATTSSSIPAAVHGFSLPSPPTLQKIVSGKESYKKKTKKLSEATFGMGCFWKPSEELLKVDGVEDTICGYTGYNNNNEKDGPSKPPSYEQVCFSRDPWVEGVRVLYDSERVSYTELLDAFFEAQEPKIGSRQYSSVIFVHDDEQKELAFEWLEKNENRIRRDGISPSFTSVENLTSFYQAEGYHQRYWQKFRPRIALIVGLIAVASGALDSMDSLEPYLSQIHSVANNLSLAGMLYVLLERKLDANVVKL